MPLQYFDADVDTADIIRALQRDGAAVVRNQVGPEVTDAILMELRKPFDEVGKCDESDFNAHKTPSFGCVFPIAEVPIDVHSVICIG